MIASRLFLTVLALPCVAALAACHKAHDVDAEYDGDYGYSGALSGDSGDGDSGDGESGDGDSEVLTSDPDDFGDDEPSGGTAAPSCDPSDCTVPDNPILAIAGGGTPCCTGGKCGTELMGTCLENDAPGLADPSCPSMEIMGFPISGCCKAEGFCGGDLSMLGLGCALTPTGDPASCGD